MTELSLTQLGDGVYAWLQPGGESGVANAGVVVDDDGITVIDTLMVRSQWEPFAAAVAALDLPVRRALLTHAHIDHCGGTKSFPHAAVYGSQQTSDVLDAAMPHRRLQGLHARVRRRVRRPRGARHPARSPTSSTAPRTSRRVVELLPAEGHTEGDILVLVADTDLCFAGDLCFFGVTPLAFQGNPAVWAEMLDAIADLAGVIVPGHGPVGGEAEVRDLQAIPLRVRRTPTAT